jgi:hypothetical protein
MNRKQKIKVLQAIKDGRLRPEDLRPANKFIFWQQHYGYSENFSMNQKTYTPDEVDTFVAENEESNKRRISCGMEEDVIIIFKYEDQEKTTSGEMRIQVDLE